MIETSLIDEEILKFKEELKGMSASELVQKKLIFGECQILDKERYFLLRLKVARNFNVHPNEVLVVGSAKLGFSIAPHKKYRHFGNESDIDVVIVSEKLFSSIWTGVYSAWKDKVIWESEIEFKKYLFQGWIRPDKLPPSNKFDIAKKWWEFFREITYTNEFGPYKITGALYKDWEFLEGYQNFAVQYCKDEIK